MSGGPSQKSSETTRCVQFQITPAELWGQLRDCLVAKWFFDPAVLKEAIAKARQFGPIEMSYHRRFLGLPRANFLF